MKTRVLIIDDDASVRKSIKNVLNAAGYEVITAADADKVPSQIVPDQIDLVLLDLNLPSRSGWDVFEHLTTQRPAMPVIIITGMSNQYQTALAAGVGALMEKPIEVLALLKTMDELLAEPEEARLRRMCGYQQDTKHLRPPTAAAPKLRRSAIGSNQQQRVPRWSDE
jgi:DNA-binding NtrC family response regulator